MGEFSGIRGVGELLFSRKEAGVKKSWRVRR